MDNYFELWSSDDGSSRSTNFFKFSPISPVVQSHLKQVYLTLSYALVACAVGAYLHTLLNIGGILTSLGSIGCICWVLAVPPHEEGQRFNTLMGAAALHGASIGPVIDMAVAIDPSILVSAFGGCAIAFSCFSASAIYAKRREFLFLGALLSSGISILLWLNFASFLFGGSSAVFMFELYMGLVVFVGYIVFDTQEIIERAHLGDLDYVTHAMNLFTDFVAVFVRILIIMVENAAEKEEEEKKKRRN